MRRIRTLIVDDSVVVRQLVARLLSSDPQVEVVGTAADGRIALAKAAQLAPDVIALDVDMPEMGGLETLAELRRRHPQIPVIMFSSLTEDGAVTTVEALALGAADYVAKPSGAAHSAEALQRVREELLPKLKAVGEKHLRSETVAQAVQRAITPHPQPPSHPASPAPRPRPWGARLEVLVVGASTGGPSALADLLVPLPRELPVPVLIVQHMPPLFTRLLADRLSARGGLPIREATHGEPVEPGRGYVAPGSFHLALSREAGQVRVQLHQGAPENSCRPAVDVLFRSVAQLYGGRVLAVVLTGMGQDGLRGAQEIHHKGGQILVQDEPTSVVWGMPGAVANAGLADRVLPLSELGAEILRRISEGRTARGGGPL